jgi:hypothetical protein
VVAADDFMKYVINYSTQIGIGIFLALYILASLFYPGGSNFDTHAKGFSWLHNYYCDLLSTYAKNEQINIAQPIAIGAMFVLCISLMHFWYLIPIRLKTNTKLGRIIRVSGIVSMLFCMLLFTNMDHDMVTNFGSFFGVVALIATMFVIFKNKRYTLFYFGCFIILLVGINNILYYSIDAIQYLPVIQKITFVAFLVWV